MPHLAVIIPAYDEAQRIGSTLARLAEYLSERPYTWQVVVVNDGSRDDTAGVVQQFIAEDERYVLVDSRPNHGKGFVVRKGILSISAEYLLICDADLATPIEELEKLWPQMLAGTPVVIGSRPLKESKLEVRQPLYRELGGRTFNKLVQLLGVRGIDDTQCGFKLFRHSEAVDIFRRCEIDGFGFDFEALMIAQDLGYKIAEVGVRWKHIEGSKFSPFRDAPRMLGELVRLRFAGKNKRIEVKTESLVAN